MKLALGKLLRQRNVKQAELARITGLSRGYISLLVSGKKQPSQDVLEKILHALKATPAEIYLLEPADQAAHDHFAQDAQDDMAGLSESGVAFIPENTAPVPIRESPTIGRQTATMIATKDHFTLAILEGDILHVDLSDKTPDGRIAIITRADPQTGEAVTLLRKATPDWILPLLPQESPQPIANEQFTYGILGTVVGLERKLR